MVGIIDRFEGKLALIEIDGRVIEIERAIVDESAQEGDVVKKIDGHWVVHVNETMKRSKKIVELMKDIWEE